MRILRASLLLLGAAAVSAAVRGSPIIEDIDNVDDIFDSAALATAQTVVVYVQHVLPLSAPAPAAPSLLAEIRYDHGQAEVINYEVPSDVEDAAHVEDAADAEDIHYQPPLYRIGLYDPATGRWLSATSVTAAANFAKGYRPHFVLTVAGETTKEAATLSRAIAVAVRGLPIDAGATRNFGPQATVAEVAAGKTPTLNRPVALTPEGKKVEPPEEKTFLQKYWWMIGIAVLVITTGGGGGEGK